MVVGIVKRTRGAKEYRLNKGLSKTPSITISRKREVRGDRAKLPSRLHLHGGLLQ
jgi:hypothetical protein